MDHPAWVLIGLGILLAMIGGIWLALPSLPWLGRLPGDVAIERDQFRVYAPLTTCLLISAVLTIVMWIVQRWTR